MPLAQAKPVKLVKLVKLVKMVKLVKLVKAGQWRGGGGPCWGATRATRGVAVEPSGGNRASCACAHAVVKRATLVKWAKLVKRAKRVKWPDGRAERREQALLRLRAFRGQNGPNWSNGPHWSNGQTGHTGQMAGRSSRAAGTGPPHLRAPPILPRSLAPPPPPL